MTDRIFTVSDTGTLRELTRAPFESEDVFQKLLADHPRLLAALGANQLILIQRELSVSDSKDGGGRWSIDHLYVDDEAVPVLVEVKRASDTRARREVVAQMLDYAANGSSYWRIEEIIQGFLRTCAQNGQIADQVLGEFLPESQGAESFWRAVEANLRAGRLRMIFVADELPKELRRIIEFLNEQMRPAEVYGIQLEHYRAADGTRTLVPSLVGATERASQTKAVAGTEQAISVEEWLERLAAGHGPDAMNAALRLISLTQSLGGTARPSATGDSLALSMQTDDQRVAWPFFIRLSTGARIETSLQYLKNRPAFSSEQARQEILTRLGKLPGLQLNSTGKLNGWPSFPVGNLLNDDVWQEFSKFATDVFSQARQASV